MRVHGHAEKIFRLGALVLIMLLCAAAFGALDLDTAGHSKGFSSSETSFSEISQNGMQIIPASCPSDPHATGECSAPTCSVALSPASVAYGQSSTLSWSSTYASTFSISSIGYVTANTPGSAAVAPLSTTIYSGTVTRPAPSGMAGDANGNLTSTCSATLTVGGPPAPTCSMSISPASIIQGQTATLSWSSTNASSGTISPTVGSVSTNGSTAVTPSSNTTYTGTFSGNGLTANCSASVSVIPTPTVSLSASPSTIARGQNSSLSWSSANATSCTGTNVSTGGATSGSVIVSPQNAMSYSVSCTGAGGTASASQSIGVSCTPVYGCSGNSVTYLAADCSLTSITSCTLPKYCSPGYTSCIVPTLTGSLSISSHVVSPGSTVTLSWNQPNAQSCSVSGTNGDSWSSISATHVSSSISARTTYTLSCDDYDADTIQDDLIDSGTITITPLYQDI